jgi:hypothetical protein
MTNQVALRQQELWDERVERMDNVITEHLMGRSTTEIAKNLGLSQAQVGATLKEWKSLASNNDFLRERATIALRGVDAHYDRLIKKTYGVLEDAEQNQSVTQRLSTIKLIADIEKTRIDLLQRAGVLENSDLARQMVETERRQEILIGILKNIVGPCPRCRGPVQEELAKVSNDPVILQAENYDHAH